MKKICILVSLLLLLLSSVASSANWQWIDSNDDYGYFFDTDTIRYTSRPYGPAWSGTAEYWLKTVYTPSSAAKIAEYCNDDRFYNTAWSVEKQKMDFYNKTLYHYARVTYYDNNGKFIETVTYIPNTDDIIPGTQGEYLMWYIQNYCKTGRAQ